MIQVPTMLFEQIQAWIVDGIFTNGEFKIKVLSVKPNLLLASKTFRIDQAQFG